ncbi:MAG TPA: type IX secretion system sortase PorU [Cyclobacteriaceae bacterium]|nr:type IX secretion system sortase PorU [Cyclobacteriaceae bacterium]
MRSVLKLAGILLWLCILPVFAPAQNSAFRNDIWLKFRVLDNNIYRIGYNDLKAAGINPDEVNPSFIHLFAFPTGMLPESNSILRPEGLQQVAVTITGEADGKFDKDDEILFFGQGPDKYEYSNSKQVFAYQNNLYSNANYYFLRVGDATGIRMERKGIAPGAYPVVDQYVDFGYYETDQYNDLKSGRDWFGEQFDVKTEITVRFSVPGIVAGSEIRFVSNLMAQSYQYSYFKMFWNNTQFLDRRMDTITQTRYGTKGAFGIDTLTVNSATVAAPPVSDQDVKIVFTKGGGNRSVGYLNYMLFTVRRKLAMYGNPTVVTIPVQQQGASGIEISSFPGDGVVWDITDPFRAVEVPITISGDVAKFPAATDINRTFAVFTKDAHKTPEFIENIPFQDIRSLATPSLIIVTHPAFLAQANRLAAHRTSAYGIDVKVVTTEQVYNEYSGGRTDVSAIRDFVRSLYKKDPQKLRNLLLFGRGSYDYKDKVFNNTNFVPIYQSRNSLDPLLTYSSDDYYGFMEDNEGSWTENNKGDHTLDIGVGRLPVSNIGQAADVVDKLIAYDKKSESSLWKQRVLFVADDGDGNTHQSQADELAESFEVLYKNYHTSKIYLDAFEQQTINAGQVSPKAKEALTLELNKGYEIVNFTGHGSERVWMQERVLDQDTPLKMKNGTRLPVFVTATCEFGRHDDPLLTSTAEMLLTRKNAGAIALVTTARPVNAITNSILNKAFYAAYFENTAGAKDLGSVFRQTKNKSLSGVANRNFSLLGDPSLRFDPPKEEILITSVATADGSNVLKALSKVTVTGEIRLGGEISTSFNGAIEAELFDKRTEHVTLGDENSPFTYKLWDHSLFRGKASVVDGEFAFEFILPEGVSDSIENGKIAMYAFTSDKSRDATGTLQNIKVGGTEANPDADVTGPQVDLFMGDTTFVDGGYANSNTYLVGKLYDKHGLNISGYGNGNLTGNLDNIRSFTVNDYFVASLDDFTTGIFSYPVNDLEEGQHTISFTAADTYGNLSTTSITFIVGPDGALVVGDLYGYPNPFSESDPATIEFTHNRAGDDLEVQVAIYDVLGRLADQRAFNIPSSTYKVTLFDWNGLSPGGTKMGSGIYLVKLVIRSVSDGAKNDRIARLFLTN